MFNHKKVLLSQHREKTSIAMACVKANRHQNILIWTVKYLSRPICDNEMISYGQTTLGRTSFSTHCVGHSNLNLHR